LFKENRDVVGVGTAFWWASQGVSWWVHLSHLSSEGLPFLHSPLRPIWDSLGRVPPQGSCSHLATCILLSQWAGVLCNQLSTYAGTDAFYAMHLSQNLSHCCLIQLLETPLASSQTRAFDQSPWMWPLPRVLIAY
jgi:hypothetical protein